MQRSRGAARCVGLCSRGSYAARLPSRRVRSSSGGGCGGGSGAWHSRRHCCDGFGGSSATREVARWYILISIVRVHELSGYSTNSKTCAMGREAGSNLDEGLAAPFGRSVVQLTVCQTSEYKVFKLVVQRWCWAPHHLTFPPIAYTPVPGGSSRPHSRNAERDVVRGREA
jgi:hypothetical protein